MTPDQIDAVGDLLSILSALTWIPIAGLYAKKRGRRPWLWALLAFFISFFSVLLLRLLPDKSLGASALQAVSDDGTAESTRERIEAEQNLRDLLRPKPH